MSLLTLAQTFRDALPEQGTGSIVINEEVLRTADIDNAADIVNSLQEYLQLADPSIEINQLSRADIVEPQEGQPLLISTGNTSFLNVLNMEVLALEYQQVDRTLSMFLQTKLPSDWLLSSSFPNLVVFPVFNSHFESPAFIFASELRDTWEVSITDQVVINLKKGLNFFSQFQFNQVQALSLVNEFLSFLNIGIQINSYFFGQIDITTTINGYSLDFPLVDLSSPVFGQQDSNYEIFSFLKVKPPRLGIRIVEFEVDDPRDSAENYTDASPELYFELPIILNDIVLNFSASLTDNSQFIMFRVTNLGDYEHTLTPGTLFQLMAGQDWLQQMPSALLSVLSGIKFYGFSMLVFIGDGAKDGVPATFNVSSIDACIGSTKPIKIFDPFQEFDFWVNWTILNPTNKESRMSLLSFQAEMQMNDIGNFGIEIAQTL